MIQNEFEGLAVLLGYDDEESYLDAPAEDVTRRLDAIIEKEGIEYE